MSENLSEAAKVIDQYNQLVERALKVVSDVPFYAGTHYLALHLLSGFLPRDLLKVVSAPSGSARRFKMMLPPGMVPQDEMTPEMVQMQAQNQAAQQAQQKIQMLEIEAKLGQMSAKTSAENARAHLSVAQAYKAVLDAHSRSDDVAQKAETAQLRTALDALDQHNALAAEDRQHVLDVLKSLADMHATVASGNAANAQADATAAMAANPPADGDGQDSEGSADQSQDTGNGATQ